MFNPQAGTSHMLNPQQAGPSMMGDSSKMGQQQSSVGILEDGTLTSAIQKGIPVSILPGANPESIVLNQVFVPVYSNTDKGPVIELVPIKAPQWKCIDIDAKIV